ncbi:MAG: hypothetical protein Q7S69_01290 [Nitrosomonadaceae bacterium]|nr:hypothetical protein [Nitrosomonadaceae bacterium]
MANFLDVASNLLQSNAVKEKRAEFDRVFSAIGLLQAVHSKAQLDLNNIESIFTVFELGRVIQRIPGLKPEEIPQTISALKELIVKTLEVTMRFPTRGSSIEAPKPYDAFAGLLSHLCFEAFPLQTASVITFNYDIAADVAIYKAGLGPDYTFEHPPNSQKVVPLLKLHGSLNWATEKEGKRIRPLHLVNYFQHYSYTGHETRGTTSVPIGTQLVEYFSKYEKIEVDAEPVIVPPSWNKADYHKALSDVWAAAATHLSEAEHIFVIGYSMPETDSFFRHLYALGSVGKSPLRTFYVYNPDTSGLTTGRFQALLGPAAKSRYMYRPLTFEQAIPEIMGFFPKRK